MLCLVDQQSNTRFMHYIFIHVLKLPNLCSDFPCPMFNSVHSSMYVDCTPRFFSHAVQVVFDIHGVSIGKTK